MKTQVLCAGELLVDLVSTNYVDELSAAAGFVAHAGGSPANLATNLSQLGVETSLIAAVGRDSFGGLLREHVVSLGLDHKHLHIAQGTPSTLITVTKSKGTPEFEVFRGADEKLEWKQFEPFVASPPRLFHTTCFALSGQPARSHILRAAQLFSAAGAEISIDANYAYKVWPDRARAQAVVKQFASYGALIKMSEDDFERLYQQPLAQATCQGQVAHLLGAGAKLVCCTFGGDGTVVVSPAGVFSLSAKPIEVVDATGAGDSFWSGFLAAHLAGESIENCVRVATGVAAIKLQQQGPLREPLDWKILLQA